MFVEPFTSDPEVVARKVAVNPKVRMPPKLEWVTDADGNIKDYEIPGETVLTRLKDVYAGWFYNNVVTWIPSHHLRQAYLRLFGATIGKKSAINRGTKVVYMKYLVIGDRTTIGAGCLLDARSGIAIGDDVIIAGDTYIIAGGHDINHPNFPPGPNPADPIVIDDYVWIATRSMILQCLIGRGAVVAAQAVVHRDVPPLAIVGGSPAKVIGQRNPEALQYSGASRVPLY